MRHFSRNILAFSVVFFASALSAATGRYWQGAGYGVWSDVANWRWNAIPTDGDCTHFEAKGYDQNVCLDTHARTGYWLVMTGTPSAVYDLVWSGNGTYTNTVTALTEVQSYRRLIVDGPGIYIKKSIEVEDNASLVMKSGRFNVESEFNVGTNGFLRIAGGEMHTSLTLNTNATLEVSGGQLTTYGTFDIRTNATVRLSGGTLSVRTAPSGLTADSFSFTGGTLKWANTEQIMQNRLYLLPPAGAVLEHRSSAGDCFYLTENGSCSFDGLIVATNRTSGHPGVTLYKQHYSFSGKGTFLLDQFYINGGYTATIRVKALNIGSRLIARGSAGAVFSFPDGISFGAWGDWCNTRTEGVDYDPPKIVLAKDVVFNTRNCIDGIAAHTIMLRRCVDAGLRTLSVTGGGTVDLSFADGLDCLDRISVAERTTLVLTNTTTTIAVRDLVMAPGSKILLAAGKGAFEVLGETDLADDARIVFNVPTELSSGKLHPVWTSAWGSDVPRQVSIVGLDESVWTVKNIKGVRYLSDGTVTEIANTDKCAWVGTNSSLWSVKANWDRGAVLSGSTYGYFSREANLFVTNDAVRAFRYFVVTANAGPYFFAGNTMRLTYPAESAIKESSNSLRHGSKFPVFVENRVESTGWHAYFRSTSDSSVQLLGGGSCKGIFYIHGDVHLGGVWCGTNISLLAKGDSMARPSRITVRKDSVLTLTAADGTLVAPDRLQINGVFEPSNTLVSVEKAAWRGTGAIRLHGVRTDGESAAFALGDALTLYPLAGWPTVSSANPAAAVTIAVCDSPTLGATKDWTYGPAADAEPEIDSSERALTVGEGAVLTIDTQDPVTGDGHRITFADPIAGQGSVVKSGSGVLSFATMDSRIAGVFKVAQGQIALDEGFCAKTSRKWIPVMTASAFEGLENGVPPLWIWRLVPTEDGLLTCELRKAGGLTLFVR